MKRLFILMLLMTVCSLTFGQTVMKYAIETNVKDYDFRTSDSVTKIYSTKNNEFYSSDTSLPALPYTNIKLLLPYDSRISNVKLSYSGKQLIGKYTLPSSSQQVFRDRKVEKTPTIMYDTSKTYPSCNLINYRQSSIDGYEVLYASVCPFEYNASTGELFLLSGLTLKYEFSSRGDNTDQHIGSNMRNIVSHLVENNEMLESLYPEPYPFSTFNYLIITADSLKTAFEPLTMLKPYKGMMTEIVSIEDIMQQYSSNIYNNLDSVEKIKYFIRNKYNYDNVGYVLLGGNCDIVPTRYCYGKIKNQTASIPTDWYYACLSSDSEYDFRWDFNRNQIYGEPNDKMDLAADLFVSRIPASNKTEIESYLSKRINYELDKQYQNDSYNKMLFAGRAVGPIVRISDAQYCGTQIGSMIQNLHNVDISYLYDTYSNIGNVTFSAATLQEQLQNENAFVHIDTHGEPSKWLTGVDIQYYLNPDEFYTSDSVMNVTNAGNTVITTSACFSNDFDATNSLGKTFLLKPDNGTLFFIGNSNNGVFITGELMENEPLIFKNMYQYLFSGQFNNIEECLYLAKNVFDHSEDSIRNWILYTLNTIGDPDFSPYLQKPGKLDVDVSLVSGWIDINTGQYNCSINQYVEEDNGVVDIQDLDDDSCVPGLYVNNVQFGITKPGWVPYILNRDYCNKLYIQDFQDASLTAKGQDIRIGSNVVDINQDYDFHNGNVVINAGQSFNIEVGHDLTITKDFFVEPGGILEITPKY